MLVVKFEAIQIELKRLPRVAKPQLAKIVSQLRGTQIVDLIIEERTDTAHSARIRIDGFGLQAFKGQVLQQPLILRVK